MTTKRGVKWELPESKDDQGRHKWPQDDRETKSISERVYSDTFEDTGNIYTDTFMTESYSDTFENTAETSGQANNFNHGFKFSKDQLSSIHTETEQIHTVITEGIQTIIEADSESEFQETAADYTTGFDTVRDTTDTHPAESYSDTFESVDKTRTDYELRTDSVIDSQKSYSQTFTQSSRSLADTVDDLDLSYIAPEYDGKSQLDDGDDTDQDEYSDTFEPTELTTQWSQSDKSLREPELDRHERQAQQKFIDQMLNKFRDKELVKERGLQVISPEPAEDSEDEYQKHYCKKKVKQLRRRAHRKDTDEGQISEGTVNIIPAPLTGDRLSDYGLTDSVLERAKLTNVMSAMKKAARRKIHEVETCAECSELKQRLESEEAEKVFAESKTKMLKSKIMDMHVENHLIKMNSISMIAELARGLPRSSERPEKIMDKLLEPLLGKNVMR